MVRITILIILVTSFLGMLISTSTNAFFTDTASATGNTFSAATSFPTLTGSITPSDTPANTPTPTTPEEVLPGKIVINEVSPVGTSLVDWVELFNSGGTSVNITGWKIQDNTSTDTFPGSITIPAGGFAVIVASGSGVVVPPSAQRIELTSAIGNALNEAGDLVRLLSNSDVNIDEMSFGSNQTIFTIANPTSVQSIRRIPNGTDTNNAADWLNGSSSIGVGN